MYERYSREEQVKYSQQLLLKLSRYATEVREGEPEGIGHFLNLLVSTYPDVPPEISPNEDIVQHLTPRQRLAVKHAHDAMAEFIQNFGIDSSVAHRLTPDNYHLTAYFEYVAGATLSLLKVNNPGADNNAIHSMINANDSFRGLLHWAEEQFTPSR